MSVIKETERVVFREFMADELDTYLNHFNDDLVTLYLPKRSKEERTDIFNTALSKYTIAKKTGIWGMFSKTDGDFIGSCLLRPFNDEPGVIELGYSLEQKYWGRGIGTEMAKAMIEHGFSDSQIKTIVAVTVLENTGSQRVLERAGFTRADNMLRDGLELAFFSIKN